MSKLQWDIWRCDLPKKGPHPVVLASHPDLCARAAVLDVLFCTSQRQSRPPRPYEVMLTPDDGLPWETFCVCDHLISVPAELLTERIGRVCFERRRALRAAIITCFRLLAND
jgi:mRNA-degrading endonuclease toxin of MazEF toxin-antitoxin module